MPKQERRLAAIMFTDIVGYTALMGSDEGKAFEFLKNNRRIQWRLIKKHKGRLLKEMGDGILAYFSSSIDAVLCAVAIQNAAMDMDLPLRIGIHQGDVIFEKKDVLGDGVNIASRIQGLADKNGIAISEAVYNEIKNKDGLKTEFLGEQSLKGIEIPFGIYKVICSDNNILDYKIDTGELIRPLGINRMTVLLGVIFLTVLAFTLYYFIPDISRPPLEDSKSIAVLPFINMTNDPKQEYFSDGITEEIITHLANIKDLSVKSRTSVFHYKDIKKEIPDIGKELGVTYILEGSIRKDRNMVRIITRLIDARNDNNIWVENYDRKLESILDIQSEVASKVAEMLNITLSKTEKKKIEYKPTNTFSAYDHYLQAMYEDKKWTVEGSRQAIKYLEKAIDLDPKYSEAYSLYVWQFIQLSVTYPVMSTTEALKLARPAAEKALKYDSLSSDAYIAMASVNYYLEWNFKQAEKHFNKSLELNSWGEAPIYQCYCAIVDFLFTHDRTNEALELVLNIRENNPAYFQGYGYESMYYMAENNNKIALELVKSNVQHHDTWIAHMLYGLVFHRVANYEEAVGEYEKGLSMANGRPGKLLSRLSMTYFRLEMIEETIEILDELIDRHDNGEFGLATFVALIFYEMEDEENMYKWLGIAYEEREASFIYLKYNDFRNVQNHPRYISLMRKFGFDN